MRTTVTIFTMCCIFFGFGNIAKADPKTICLHNKGGYIAKLIVYEGSSTSYTKKYETGNITAGFTKCVEIPEVVSTIEADAVGVGVSWNCNFLYSNTNPLPGYVTITTKGTIFNPSCEKEP